MGQYKMPVRSDVTIFLVLHNQPRRNPASKRNIATGKLGNAAGRK